MYGVSLVQTQVHEGQDWTLDSLSVGGWVFGVQVLQLDHQTHGGFGPSVLELGKPLVQPVSELDKSESACTL